MQTEDVLTGDDLKHYEVEIEAMNLILISIPNDIYNCVDACTTAQAMWQRVERLMQGTVQNKVDRETRFNNEFDQFFAELGEALVSYVTQVRLAKRLKDDFFDYLSQYEKLVNRGLTSRARNWKSLMILLRWWHIRVSSFRIPSPYYVTHPSSVVDYDDDYQGDAFQNNSEDPLTSAMMLLALAITQRFSNPTNNHLRTSSNTINQAIVQADRVNIQSRNSSNDARNTRCSYVQEEVIESTNVQNDARNIQRTLQTASSRTTTNVQTSSTSYVNPLFAKDNQEQKYPKQPKIINNTIGDDQINSNIIFDEPNGDVNSSSVENDNNAQASYELEQLARNAYKEAKKQQIIAKKVQQQNTVLTKQLESYKEKVWVFEKTKGYNITYSNENIEADQKAKRFEQESQSQFIHDRDIIRDLE
ncbi:hypothetical protein Tco_0276531 [Tanacetum coccineum]